MDKLELILYNVGHGLAVSLIERPENYVTQIDLGAEENFSPLWYLMNTRRLRADILYITHPHADHLSDIVNASNSSLRPYYLYYQDYDWDDVIEKEKPERRETIKQFLGLTRTVSRGSYSGHGDLRSWRWTPENALNKFGESRYINNSSLFIIYTWRQFKISIAGDLETDALESLLTHEDFKSQAAGTDILIAAHHGHSNGFTSKWPEVVGKPYVTLISVQNRDPSVAPGYSSAEYARGWTIEGTTRYSLTTRTDGNIIVNMSYSSEDKPVWDFNLAK